MAGRGRHTVQWPSDALCTDHEPPKERQSSLLSPSSMLSEPGYEWLESEGLLREWKYLTEYDPEINLLKDMEPEPMIAQHQSLVVADSVYLVVSIQKTFQGAFHRLGLHAETPDWSGSAESAVSLVQVMAREGQHYSIIVIAGEGSFAAEIARELRTIGCLDPIVALLQPAKAMSLAGPPGSDLQEMPEDIPVEFLPITDEQAAKLVEERCLYYQDDAFSSTLFHDLCLPTPKEPFCMPDDIMSPQPSPIEQVQFKLAASPFPPRKPSPECKSEVPPLPVHHIPTFGGDNADSPDLCGIFWDKFGATNAAEAAKGKELSFLFDNSRKIIFQVDCLDSPPRPTICYVSPGIETLLGFTQERLVGCTMEESLVGPGTSEDTLQELKRCMIDSDPPMLNKYINLYHADCSPVSSYVGLRPLTSHRDGMMGSPQLYLMTIKSATTLGCIPLPTVLDKYFRNKGQPTKRKATSSRAAPKRQRRQDSPSSSASGWPISQTMPGFGNATPSHTPREPDGNNSRGSWGWDSSMSDGGCM